MHKYFPYFQKFKTTQATSDITAFKFLVNFCESNDNKSPELEIPIGLFWPVLMTSDFFQCEIAVKKCYSCWEKNWKEISNVCTLTISNIVQKLASLIPLWDLIRHETTNKNGLLRSNELFRAHTRTLLNEESFSIC